ncbi:MAG: radical SAM protein [Acidobacteria bacterium]|nr:radical SAM protein [Acidobacteriota bacterium]
MSKVAGEQISKFLKKKLNDLKNEFGENSYEYTSLARQYLFDKRETEVDYKSERRRHYEADLTADSSGHVLTGVERLYRRCAVFELTTACKTRCRWCLRANYNPFTLKKDEIENAARYFGSEANRDELKELLITGGDPLIVPDLLNDALECIQKYAPNIRIIRIGTRLPVQDPDMVFSDKLAHALRRRDGMRLEIGTQINSPVELFPESVAAYHKLQEYAERIYNQQVLLKGVNDALEPLVQLYEKMRDIGIEPHYMFHCVPLHGMEHHRTTVEEGLDLIKSLVTSGYISGRSKPMYTAMTDIGKITFYEGVFVDRKGDMFLLQSRYRYEDRMKWNPDWKMPESAEVDENGYLRVWYKDAKTHNKGWESTYIME